jgi:IS4 transposase
MEATALEIAMLYKQRWQVELFFKWIKQHLKIKSFWGTSENAVRIQIYSAITTYCMVVMMAEKMKLKRSTYEILQVLGISLLDKTPVNQIFNDVDYNNDKERNCKQLKISLF